MGKFSLEKLFGMTIRESATDGSDFTNPDADYRRLFLGEDGQLHVKDSAGTVTDIGVAGGAVATDAIWDAAGDLAVGSGANTAAKLTMGAAGGAVSRVNGAVAWNSGTGFPTAATGDRFWRTDDRCEYFYDGAQWLSVELSHMTLSVLPGPSTTGLSATGDVAYATIPLKGTDLIYIEKVHITLYVATTNDAGKYWNITFQEGDDGTPAYTTLGSSTTQSLAADQYLLLTATVNAAIPSDSQVVFFNAAKVSTPGNLYCNGAAMNFRRIGT